MKRFPKELSDGQRELWSHERTATRRTVKGKRQNRETPLPGEIVKWAEAHPGIVRIARTHCGISFRGPAVLHHAAADWSDLTGALWFGVGLFVECKREGKPAMADQMEFLATMRQWGHVVIVAHSVTEFVAELKCECARRGHPIEEAA